MTSDTTPLSLLIKRKSSKSCEVKFLIAVCKNPDSQSKNWTLSHLAPPLQEKTSNPAAPPPPPPPVKNFTFWFMPYWIYHYIVFCDVNLWAQFFLLPSANNFSSSSREMSLINQSDICLCFGDGFRTVCSLEVLQNNSLLGQPHSMTPNQQELVCSGNEWWRQWQASIDPNVSPELDTL